MTEPLTPDEWLAWAQRVGEDHAKDMEKYLRLRTGKDVRVDFDIQPMKLEKNE